MADKVFRWLLISFIVFAFLYGIWSLISEAFDLRLETFLRDNHAVLISLGTLALISVLALLTSYLSDKAADKREHLAAVASEKRVAFNQKVQAELQIAQFRQSWINEMRNDISKLLRIEFHHTEEADIANAYTLHMKIEMRLNPDEELASKLSAAMQYLGRSESTEEEHQRALADVVLASRAYLKNEWRRLKKDIRESQLLESDPL